MNERESREEDPLEKDERDRSNFVREIAVRGESPASHRDRRCVRLARRDDGAYRQYSTEEQRSQAECSASRMQLDFHHGLIVQRPNELGQVPATLLATPPKRIVQFWDDLDRLPEDVRECMESWKKLEQSGFELQVFDESSAREFIRVDLGSRHVKAFDKCYHPSMKSDYFRYSYIFVEGGFYIDADDVYHGTTLDHLFSDGRLKLQPFCYDIATAQMVPPSDFTNLRADQSSWIFYFNPGCSRVSPGCHDRSARFCRRSGRAVAAMARCWRSP